MKQLNEKENSSAKVNALMWHVIKQMRREKKLILDKFNLTCSQYELLSAINDLTELRQEIIQVELSEKTGIDPMNTSTILRNLQKRGLVARSRNAKNTRVVNVELTTKGQKLYEKAFFKMKESNDLIYQRTDKDYLISQLLLISKELNNLNV